MTTLDATGSYPVTVDVDRPAHVGCWRPLVLWLLCIPLFVVAYVYLVIATFAVLVGWLVAVFTGVVPESSAISFPPPRQQSRLTVLFRLVLLLPQAIVLYVVGLAAGIVSLLAWFAVLFTGRWPESMRTFYVGYLRWTFRVSGYFYLLTDAYPPFSPT